jgi:cytochrome c553
MTMSPYFLRNVAAICLIWAGTAVAEPPVTENLINQVLSVVPDAQHGHVLYLKRCSRCHGSKGWGNGVKEVPALAGQRERYIVVQLAQFATLERNGSAMHRATSPPDVGHAQAIRDLAAYLSRAPFNPDPEQGDGKAILAGQQLYERQCAMCHGKGGQGSSEDPIPALAGQHYPYTLVQLQNFAAGHRGQVEPPVIDFTAGLSDEAREAVADYLSRLKPAVP